MANSGEAQPFSWKRAALHVGVPFLLALIACAVAVALTKFDDPEAMGEETGRLMVPGLFLGLLASYLAQTKRTVSAWICGALAVFVFAGSVAVPILKRTRAHAVDLDGRDTAPLEIVDIDGEPYFHHPYLKFAFKQPSPEFVANADAQGATRGLIPSDPSIHAYALAESFPGPLILVTVQKSNRVDREQLEGFVNGLSQIKQKYADAAQEIESEIVWEPSFRGATLHFVINEDNHFRVYAQVGDFGTDSEYIVALVALSLGEDSFDDVLASFRTYVP